jgi:hypothetical protein
MVERLKIPERPETIDGKRTADTRVGRSSLRTDLRIAGGAGLNIPRMS